MLLLLVCLLIIGAQTMEYNDMKADQAIEQGLED